MAIAGARSFKQEQSFVGLISARRGRLQAVYIRGVVGRHSFVLEGPGSKFARRRRETEHQILTFVPSISPRRSCIPKKQKREPAWTPHPSSPWTWRLRRSRAWRGRKDGLLHILLVLSCFLLVLLVPPANLMGDNKLFQKEKAGILLRILPWMALSIAHKLV